MAKKKVTKEESLKSQDGALVRAAKVIGDATGKLATAVGVTEPAKRRAPKLAKKNKERLPRKQKKEARKASKKSA